MAIKGHGQDVHPVAIVGLSCRFPSDGDNLDNFWRMICRGQSAWSEIPKDRFSIDAFHDPAGNVNTSITRGAHFLKQDVSRFDAKFFNLSKAEADAMDPQHRIMIEVAYEALEKAGLTLESLTRSRTGVFMGHFTSDYRENLSRDPECAPTNTLTGSSQTSLANRISWLFDLQGPSFSLDTACSSSLVSLHLACQSLQSGESDMAIVGGVNLLLNPEMFMYLSNQHFLSPDGRCKSFDELADGYGRGEGFAALVLKRVDDAVMQNDIIRAVIRGTGINHSGHTKGLTLPSAEAQARLIRDTYRLANLDYSDTNYVEAHGTGTQAGDSQETDALSRTISRARPPDRKLLIGSVKSNIGHLEACAGLAGVIKSVLILENGMIPPTIHYTRGNPNIKFDEWKLEVPTTLTPWPTTGIRRISVNSFGYGGANAHVILDDAYSYLQSRSLTTHHQPCASSNTESYGTTESTKDDNDCSSDKHEGQCNSNGCHMPRKTSFRPQVLVFSAQSRESLEQMHSSLVRYLADVDSNLKDPTAVSHFMHNLAYTLDQRRSALQWRSSAVAATPQELATFLNSKSSTSTIHRTIQAPRIGFVFTGQGAQWARMGVELMQIAAFRESVDAADQHLNEAHGCSWSVVEELGKRKATSVLHLAEYSQTICTVLQIALVDLLKTWSVVPAAVVGHSSGEIAAAYCLGALCREDAWTLAYNRGALAKGIRANAPDLHGTMAAVSLSDEQAELYISRIHKGEVVVACVNSPSSVTISGDTAGIDELLQMLKADDVFARKLHVDVAYHSPHMQVIAQDYYEAISDIETRAVHDDRVMASSVTGTKVDVSELGAAYWVRNLTSPVQFSAAVHEMVRPFGDTKRFSHNATDILVEIGPHHALQGPVIQSLKAHGITDVQYTSAIVRNQDGLESILSLVGFLWSSGVAINTSIVNNDINVLIGHNAQLLVDLPTYPWDHSHSWGQESRLTKEYLSRAWPALSLLGAPLPSLVHGQYNWRKIIRLSEEPWIRDHKISGSVIYPGAGYIAMAIEAIAQIVDRQKVVASFKLRSIKFTIALILNEKSGTECTIQLRSDTGAIEAVGSNWMEFSVTTCTDGKTLQQNCRGFVMVEYQSSGSSQTNSQKSSNLLRLKERRSHAAEVCKNRVDPAQFYKNLYDLGLEYGPSFTNAIDIYTASEISSCVLSIPDIPVVIIPNLQHRPHIVHPGTLDASFHLAFAALYGGGDEMTQVMVPHMLEEIVISANIPYKTGQCLNGFSTATKHDLNELHAEICLFDEANEDFAIDIKGLICTGIGASASVSPQNAPSKTICSKVTWYPAIDLLTQEEKHRWINRSCVAAMRSGTDKADNGWEAVSQTLYMYLRLNHITRPSLSILEIVNQEVDDSSKTLLSRIKGLASLDTAEYTIAYSNSQAITATRRVTFGPEIATSNTLAHLSQHSKEPELERERFDIVIVSNNFEATDSLDTTVRHAKRLLKDEGELCCIINDKGGSDAVNECVEVLRSSLNCNELLVNFSIDHAEYPSLHQYTFLAASPRKDTAANKQAEEVLILQPPKASKYTQKFSAHLSDTLRSLHFQTTILAWGQETLMAQSRRRIILLEMDDPYLFAMDENDFSILKHVISNAKDILWVCGLDEPEAGMISGLARVVRNEMPGTRFRTLHTGASAGLSVEDLAEMTSRVYGYATREDEFSIRDGLLCVSRIEEDDAVDNQLKFFMSDAGKIITTMPLSKVPGPVKLAIHKAGDLESLCFELDPTPETMLAHDEVEIGVKATTIDSSAFTSSTNRTSNEVSGLVASGIVRRIGSNVDKFKIGDSVAMFGRGSHRTVHRSKADLCESVPKGLSFEEAASVPMVHGTAWYGLVDLARVQMGQSILIHAAAGGIGQSAVQIAQHYGMEIFITARSSREREMLHDAYRLADDHILNVEDSNLVHEVKRMTQGRGVDVVLGIATREALRQLRECVAPFGHFLATGTKRGSNDTDLDIQRLPQDVSYSFYELNRIEQSRPDLMTTIISNTFDLLRRGVIRPVTPLIKNPISQIKESLALVQNDDFVGEVALTFPDEAVVPILSEPQQFSIHEDSVVVLVGGLGGLGRSIAKLLVNHGARRLCFLSRSGDTSPQSRELLNQLRDQGVKFRVYSCDVADVDALETALAQCSRDLGSVKGVIQCAMVLRDTLFSNMTYQDWIESTRPKVQASWNLHYCLQDVEFFIMLSSFAATIGNHGQSNYAAGCSFQDALAHHRRAAGLHAVALDLGIMRDVGYLAENGAIQNLKEWEEPYGIREETFHALLKCAITGDSAGNVPAQIITGLATGGSAIAAGIPTPFYLKNSPRFSIMARLGLAEQTNNPDHSAKMSTQTLISQASSLEAAVTYATDALVDHLAQILHTSASDIDPARFIHSYGIDSLSAIEVVNWAKVELKATITAIDVMATVPMFEVARKIVRSSGLVGEELLAEDGR